MLCVPSWWDIVLNKSFDGMKSGTVKLFELTRTWTEKVLGAICRNKIHGRACSWPLIVSRATYDELDCESE